MKTTILVLALVALVQADMYLHNPRGSNNRLDEARRDRNNANRVFDSQNNNRGGYNVGSLYYYAGSILPIEWTNQHSCGDPNNHCEIIFQYMCDDLVRDGASTNTIPDNPVLCENFDCNTDLEYGMHESFDYYLNCKRRSRNLGLFTADQNLGGNRNAAINTRQNPNGNRRGYECPEERDYYPYWHPTPWRDIAILTNDATRCQYYQEESANVKSRFACVLDDFIFLNLGNMRIPIDQESCEAFIRPDANGILRNGTWTEFPADPRLSAPDCVETLWSRDNHLGNGMGGYPNYYNWTIPDIPHEHCVFRARYNISTAEYDGFDGAVNSSLMRVNRAVFNDETNEVNKNVQISELDVYSMYGFDSEEEARARGYVFRNNPVVKIFPDPTEDSVNFGLQLAINTAQFGRTFQDRSHTFAIRSQPDDLECSTIYNLNVRGKRGNIVQVYPGVEYDFVPNTLHASVDSCIHIQWTGSNTNPNNNDGQGKQGTDRSNFVLLGSQVYEEGMGVAVPEGEKHGHWGRSYPAHLDDSRSFLGFDRETRENLAMLTPAQYGGEMSELDDAGTYYDLGPMKVTQTGTYHYLCTRNNNFTNRSQKGKIIVGRNALSFKRIGFNGGSIEAQSASLEFRMGDLTEAVVIRMETYPDAESALADLDANSDFDANAPGNEVSDYVLVDPMGEFQESGSTSATIRLEIDSSATGVKIYRANAQSGWAFRELDTTVTDGTAEASTSEGGIFVASTTIVTVYIIVFTIIAVLIIVTLIVVGVVVYFVVRRDKWRKTKDKVSGGVKNVSRSFARKV